MRQASPGYPERLCPGPVRPLSPYLGLWLSQSRDPQRVAVGQRTTARVDLGVEPGRTRSPTLTSFPSASKDRTARTLR